MNRVSDNKSGFTLFEVLIALAIAGTLLAVILPTFWRARHDANYTLIRQSAVELGKWANEWVDRNLAAQENADTCTADDYMESLVGYTGGLDETNAANNWAGTINTLTAGCRGPGTANKVTFTVAGIMAEEAQPRNPFTGHVYFNSLLDGRKAMPGLLYNGVVKDSEGFNNYYFIFTASDASSATDWYAGMGDGLPPKLAELRNGILVARLKP